jgi:UDP-N-acetyl-D-glucosamine dehydrogenase
VLVHDPLFSDEEIAALDLEPASLPPTVPIDAAILQAGHADYRELDFRTLAGCKVVLDGRGFFEPGPIEDVGMRYIAIGRPLARP